MARKRPEGWRNKKPGDPYRHGLSAKGIPNAPMQKPATAKSGREFIVYEPELLRRAEGMWQEAFRVTYERLFGPMPKGKKSWELPPVDGVYIEPYEKTGSFTARFNLFGGIKMWFYDEDSKKVWRIVLVKDGKLDITKVREKFLELRDARLAAEGRQKARTERRESREEFVKKARKDAGIEPGGSASLAVGKYSNELTLTLRNLSPEQVKRAMAAIKK